MYSHEFDYVRSASTSGSTGDASAWSSSPPRVTGSALFASRGLPRTAPDFRNCSLLQRLGRPLLSNKSRPPCFHKWFKLHHRNLLRNRTHHHRQHRRRHSFSTKRIRQRLMPSSESEQDDLCSFAITISPVSSIQETRRDLTDRERAWDH